MRNRIALQLIGWGFILLILSIIVSIIVEETGYELWINGGAIAAVMGFVTLFIGMIIHK